MQYNDVGRLKTDQEKMMKLLRASKSLRKSSPLDPKGQEEEIVIRTPRTHSRGKRGLPDRRHGLQRGM